jgi:phosphoserine phosphatase
MCDDDAQGDPGDTMAEVVGRMVKRLRQHCDAVQVLAVKYDADEDQTYTVSDGAGNWQARYGAMREWLVRTEARSRHRATRDDESDDD